MKQDDARLRGDSGMAVGVILFALALIAVISIAMSAGNNFTGSTISTDRINSMVRAQALLIATKIRECYANGYANKQTECQNNVLVNGVSSRSGCSPIDTTVFYPSSTGTGTVVDSVTCPSYSTGAQNLWTGQSPMLLPAPPGGLDSWYYVNAGDSGGRCIRIAPLPGNLTDQGVKQGLIEAANGYSAQEISYSSGSASQRFVFWITKPTGTQSADCTP